MTCPVVRSANGSGSGLRRRNHSSQSLLVDGGRADKGGGGRVRTTTRSQKRGTKDSAFVLLLRSPDAAAWRSVRAGSNASASFAPARRFRNASRRTIRRCRLSRCSAWMLRTSSRHRMAAVTATIVCARGAPDSLTWKLIAGREKSHVLPRCSEALRGVRVREVLRGGIVRAIAPRGPVPAVVDFR